jgi:type I restriction enzyme S subunit
MRVKHLVTVPVAAGLNLPAETGEPEWPRYVRTTDIEGPSELGDDVVRVNPTVVRELALHRDDLLVCRTGSLGTTYLHDTDELAAFAGYLVRVRPNVRRVVPRWLAYWFRSSSCQRQIGQGAIRSTIDNFNATKIGNLGLDVPGLAEQAAVADFLDRECARIEDLCTTLNATASSASAAHLELLRTLVLERDWPVVPLKFYAKTGTGHTPSRQHPEYWIDEDCGLPWFTLADVHQIRDGRQDAVTDTSERISRVGLANSSAVRHPAGTVLLSRTASVGFSAVMGVDMAVSQDFMTWTCGPDLDPRYLLIALRAMQPELRRLMYGSTHKTIYMPDLQALRVPMPSVDRQREIIEQAAGLACSTWPLIDEIEEMNDELREYRDALICEAVTGQIEVAARGETATEESLDAVHEYGRHEALA